MTDSTCLQFPALDAVLEGFDVRGVIDASGAVSEHERAATVATLSQAGVKVRNWWSVAVELQADWRRDEAKGWPMAMIFREHLRVGATCSTRIQRMREGRWSRQSDQSKTTYPFVDANAPTTPS